MIEIGMVRTYSTNIRDIVKQSNIKLEQLREGIEQFRIDIVMLNETNCKWMTRTKDRIDNV